MLRFERMLFVYVIQIHSISWFDHEHFLSIDNDGRRIRTWNINRKEAINESLSLQGTIQSLHVHSILNNSNNQKEYFIAGISMNERSLVIFEYTQSNDDRIDLSTNIVACQSWQKQSIIIFYIFLFICHICLRVSTFLAHVYIRSDTNCICVMRFCGFFFSIFAMKFIDINCNKNAY